MGYKQELDALGRWVFQIAGLRSHHLSAAPPQVARPVILWEAPSRSRGRNLGNYHFTKTPTQYGKLYVNNLDELADLIDLLEKNLGDRFESLPVYESDKEGAAVIGRLRNVQFDTGTSQNVDIPITVRYEALYSRPTPEEAPAATKVTNSIIYKGV